MAGTGSKKGKYTVFVADNYHYQDEGAEYKLGDFNDRESALAACKEKVDDYLARAYKPGMTPDALYSSYTMFGKDPFIISEVADCKFSAWGYAKERCVEITGEEFTEEDICAVTLLGHIRCHTTNRY